MSGFNVGDRVRSKSSGLEGIVVMASGEILTIEAHGIEYAYLPEHLEPVAVKEFDAECKKPHPPTAPTAEEILRCRKCDRSIGDRGRYSTTDDAGMTWNGPYCHPPCDGRPVVMSKDAEFVTLDSGERAEYASGMVRDSTAGKPRYDLIPRAMLKRLAELYARGAVKYGDRNWELADSEEEVARFRESANRHFEQWFQGDRDEDHASAAVFNIFAAELTQAKVKEMPES